MSVGYGEGREAAGEEWRAIGGLSGRMLGALVDVIGDTHQAVGKRVGNFLPPAAKQVNDAHLATAAATYALVAHAHRAVPAVSGHVLAMTAADRTAPSYTPTGKTLQAIVNGLKGDLVAADHPQLAIRMAIRRDGQDVLPSALADAFPRATGHVVVFLHGLLEDERCWAWGQRGDGYPDRLADDTDLTPVLVRYNPGLHVSDNGELLDRLLADLVAAWPVPLESVSFVGHSMGGLVARSACQAGQRRGSQWISAVSCVVTLGTPHKGSPVERGAHVLDWVARRIPEAEPLGRVVAQRAAGIKDLRYGLTSEADWAGHNPDELLRDRRTPADSLPGVRYCWLAGTVTADPGRLWGRVVGDGLVRLPSASALDEVHAEPVGTVDGAHLAGLSHLGMLNDDAVYTQLRQWLEPNRNTA